MSDYWPWWLGAVALGGITFLHWRLTGWTLGVSGSWAGALGAREERAKAELARAMQANAAEVEAALLAETAAQFGEAAMTAGASAPAAAPAAVARQATPYGAHLVFLVMLAAGGLLSQALAGGVGAQVDLGAVHTALVGDGALRVVVLLLGGLLVGFGTRMAGGCTTGHGLSGMARLQPGSLASTASFFGAAVLVSFLLDWVSR